MQLSVKELSELFTSYRGCTDETIDVMEVYTDSRKKSMRGLFIPIIGDNFDGHDFLKDAINEGGAIASLWQKDKEVPRYVPTNFPLFFVDDPLEGLQDLAKYYLKKVNPYVIGITGSNGKTTTKDIVYSVTSEKYRTHKTKGNYNNHIGVPLTILDMPESTEVLILEMGMNHFGEIELLSKLAEPNLGIITNIGESHIEYLGSREGIAKAKMEMKEGLQSSGKLIIDGDEPLLTKSLGENHVITCGLNETNNLQLSSVMITDKGIQFYINGGVQRYEIPLLGIHNAKNAAYAVVVGKELGIPENVVAEGLKNVEMTGMRLERFFGKNGSLILNDAYNSSPTSMKAAIETVKSLSAYEEKVVVLGDMFELGKDEEAMHRSVASAISEPITSVITIGKKAKWISDELNKVDSNIQVRSFENKEDVLLLLEKELSPHSVVLFKASRGAKFETIISELKEEKEDA